METGANEGVVGSGSGTTLVTIDGVGSLFAIDDDEFAGKLGAKLIKTTGRGDAGSDTYRLDDDYGSWNLTGRIRGDKRPMPKYLSSATGNVRFVQRSIQDGQGTTAAVNYFQFAACFTAIEFEHAPTDKGGEDVWTLSFTLTKSGRLTQGWDGLVDADETALSALPVPTGGKPWAVCKEVIDGVSKSLDPAAIETSARQEFDAVGVLNTDAGEEAVLVQLQADGVSPLTGLKIARKTITRTGTLGVRAVLDWEIDGSDDRIQNAGQVSTRSSLEPFTKTAIEFMDTNSDCETVADLVWVDFQAEAFSDRLTVRKLNRFKAMIVKQYSNPGIGLVADTFGMPEYQIARVNSGNVQVYVRRKLTRGSGSYRYILGRSRKRRVAREFTISRLVTADTVPDFQSIIETANNATFLGLSAGSVLYLSSHVNTNIGLVDDYSMEMLYRFLWVSGGHYSIDGWAPEIAATASVSPGWVNVSSLTASGLASAVPDQNDFSVFLDTIP